MEVADFNLELIVFRPRSHGVLVFVACKTAESDWCPSRGSFLQRWCLGILAFRIMAKLAQIENFNASIRAFCGKWHVLYKL